MAVPCYLSKCPYYKSEHQNQIRCSGVLPVASVTVNFIDIRQARTWKNKFCRKIDGEKDCPIALTIAFEQDVFDGEKKKKDQP